MINLILFGSFFVMLLLNIPIAVSLGMSSIFALLYSGSPLTVVPTNVYNGMAKFLLLAIPFFVLSGNIMAKAGIEAEVIDLITLSPWDKETVLNSVKKTHRLCIVHEAVKQGGFGAEISATVAEEAMEYLDAPILRYGAPFCPIPFAPTLEKMVKVVPEDLVKGIKGMF